MDDATQAAAYRFFDHTADIGVEVTAPTLELLFETAAIALFDLLFEPRPGAPASVTMEREVQVKAADREELLVRWLAELLYLHDTEGLVFHRFEVQDLGVDSLSGRAAGERYDPERHHARTGIKAVTYHQVQVSREGERWKARIVLDV